MFTVLGLSVGKRSKLSYFEYDFEVLRGESGDEVRNNYW